MKKLHIITAVIVVVAILIAGWVIGSGGSEDTEELPVVDTTLNSEDATDDAATSELVEEDLPLNDDELVEEETELSNVSLDISMDNFSFSTTQINAKPGDVVEVFLVTSEGNHDFVLDELGVKSSVLASGETETIRFTVPESAAGQTYEFYCSVGNHRALGMVGTLVVE